MFKYVALLLVCSQVAFAVDVPEPDNVVLHAGDKAPWEGVLINPSRVQRLTLLTEKLTESTTLLDLKTQEATILQQRVSNLDNENNQLTSRLASQTTHSFWEQVGMFALGAVCTSLIAYSAVRLAK